MAATSETKTYTLEVVKQHNKPDDLWIILNGKVYDVTKFRHEHPGGEDSLDEVAGRDATAAFNEVGHSQEAKQMLTKYYIGDVEGCGVFANASVSTSTSSTLPTQQQQAPTLPIETPETNATTTNGEQVVPAPEKQCCAVA